MINTLTLATTTTHGGSFPAPLTIVVVIAAVGYVLWSRMQGRPLKLRRLILLPVILAVLGITDLTGSSAPHLIPKDIAFLVIGIAVSAVLGAARGATIEIYPHGGELWQRYRRTTVGLWIALIASKVVLLAVAHSAGASAGAGTNSLLLSLGVSLLAEAAIVGPRAMSTGLPFATNGKEPQRSSVRAPYGAAPRPPAPTRAELRQDDRTQSGPPPQASDRYQTDGYRPDGYRTDGYRSDRHRSRRGPIHRLLGEAAARQRQPR